MTREVSTLSLPWVLTEETCPDCGDEVVLALGELGETTVECGCGSVLVLG